MGDPSDEAAADQAERNGGRLRTPDHARIYAYDYFASCWRRPQLVLFSSCWPKCDRCGCSAIGDQAPERAGGRWRYRVHCACGEDTIESDFPLCTGGDERWWRGTEAFATIGEQPDEAEETMGRKRAATAEEAAPEITYDLPRSEEIRADTARAGALRLSDLLPVEYNARQITDRQAQALGDTIEDFGFLQPLVINAYPGREMRIVGGEQRWRQLRALYGDDAAVPDLVSVDPQTGEERRTPGYVLVSLDEPSERELNIRLNRVGGEWDWSKLDSDFTRDDLMAWGFEHGDFRARKGKAAAEGGDDGAPPAEHDGPAVKMLYLFCTPAQHEQLTADAQALQDLYGTGNFTETVCAAARAAAEAT